MTTPTELMLALPDGPSVNVASALREGQSSQLSQALRELGRGEQRAAAEQIRLLDGPLEACDSDLAVEGAPARALQEIRRVMERIQPGQSQIGWFRRLLIWLGLASDSNDFAKRVKAARSELDGQVAGLEAGRDRLRRDNITLEMDLESLESCVAQLSAKHEQARAALSAIEAQEGEHEEIEHLAAERALAISEQLAVSQQAVLALRLIMQNNQTLIDSLERALQVSVSAVVVADRASAGLAAKHQAEQATNQSGQALGEVASAVSDALAALDAADKVRSQNHQGVQDAKSTVANA